MPRGLRGFARQSFKRNVLCRVGCDTQIPRLAARIRQLAQNVLLQRVADVPKPVRGQNDLIAPREWFPS
jgi:hypothetical protein